MSDSALYSIHLSTALSWRGGENQAYLLARGLLAKRDRVRIVAPPGAPLTERCAAAGIDVTNLRMRGEFDVFGAMQLCALLRRERPDVLHLHDGHGVMPGRIAARLSRLPHLKVVAHRRTVFALRGRGKFGGCIDRVIAISEAVKKELLKARVLQERIRVVYSGIDFPSDAATTDDAQRLRDQAGIPPDAFLAGHAAALTPEKRQADILGALAKTNAILRSRQLAPLHLAIAGTGELEQELRSRAAAPDLQGCVHFLGFIRDTGAFWAACQVAIFASEAEGLCTALIEAQGAGLAAVATRAGGMPEVVEDGVTGVIVTVGDIERLSQALLAFQADADLLRRMGSMAKKRARLYFSANAMISGIRDVYTELLS